MSEANEFRFVTTGPPGPKNECVFVELEDEQGHGLGPDVATWREHQSGSGLWSLCVPDLRAALAEATPPPADAATEAPITCEEIGCPTCCPSPAPAPSAKEGRT